MMLLAVLLTLSADVDYDFVDQNGFGWATTGGKVTVTLTITEKAGTLAIKGKRRWTDGQLVAGKTPDGAPDMKTTKWEGEVDESYPLYDVARSGDTITFKVDPGHDKLTGTCTPTKIAKLASTTLWECSLAGFQWKTIANLPEVHHPIVLDANRKAKDRILNTFHGAAKPKFGQRAVSAVKPASPKAPAKP